MKIQKSQRVLSYFVLHLRRTNYPVNHLPYHLTNHHFRPAPPFPLNPNLFPPSLLTLDSLRVVLISRLFSTMAWVSAARSTARWSLISYLKSDIRFPQAWLRSFFSPSLFPPAHSFSSILPSNHLSDCLSYFLSISLSSSISFAYSQSLGSSLNCPGCLSVSQPPSRYSSRHILSFLLKSKCHSLMISSHYFHACNLSTRFFSTCM